MTESSPPAWGGDPSIAWRILLTAVPTSLPTVEQLAAWQAALHEAQGWPAPLPVARGDAGAGGSGISLGAVVHDGRTVLTLRARAASWDAAGLDELLARVVARLT